MKTYAVLDNENKVKFITTSENVNIPDNWVEIPDTTSVLVLGKTYENGSFVNETNTVATTSTAGANVEPRTDWSLWVSTQEVYRDEDMNHSLETDLDAIETTLSGKADKNHTHTGYASSDHTHTMANLTETDSQKIMTAAERTKLSSIAENANNYSHPTSHSASMITGLSNVATSGSYNDLTDKPTIPTIPSSLPANGGDSDTVDGKHAADFADADHNHDTDYSNISHTHTQYATTGHTHTLDDVSETTDKKIMTATERTKLSGIATGANKYTHPSTHAASMITGLASVATSGDYDDLINKPTGFAPTAHTHAQNEITNLTTTLATKVNVVDGKSLSTNDYTTVEKTKLAGIETGANKTTVDSVLSSTSTNPIQNKIVQAALAEKAAISHSHNDTYYTETEIDNKLTTKSDTSHNHDEAYAAINHTHDYVPTAGGSISGDLEVLGVLKVGGQQAFYYASNAQTIGSNNASSGTTICCGSSANVTVNGARMYTPALLPRTTQTYQIGNTSYRYNGIYLVNQPNVSSDERLKENIVNLEESVLADFINKLNVVEYQYKGDNTKRIGLIAQQVTNADPNLSAYFVEQDENGYYGMKPGDLVFPLIAAVKELSRQVEKMKTMGDDVI